MTSTDIQTAVQNALTQLYTNLPNDQPIVLNPPVNLFIFDENRYGVIEYNVGSVQKIGVDIWLNNAYQDDDTEEQAASYEIQDREHDESILDIYEACKAARPDLFQEWQTVVIGDFSGEQQQAPEIPTEILQALCYYDPRNPNALEDDRTEDYKKRCYCDNCFYGRTELAQMYINLVNTNI